LLLWAIPPSSWQQLFTTYAVDDEASHIQPNYWIGLGVPVISLLISAGLVAIMGLSGRLLDVRTREWWHRIGGINMGLCVVWLALFACALYMP
ncbi:hypothetical protein LW977_17865, partial [Erwinia amylovora]|uniref:hypothetical protein n=1 Tax=Erwinia amylovora TaxID=552 RepID=UPI0020BFEAFE